MKHAAYLTSWHSTFPTDNGFASVSLRPARGTELVAESSVARCFCEFSGPIAGMKRNHPGAPGQEDAEMHGANLGSLSETVSASRECAPTLTLNGKCWAFRRRREICGLLTGQETRTECPKCSRWGKANRNPLRALRASVVYRLGFAPHSAKMQQIFVHPSFTSRLRRSHFGSSSHSACGAALCSHSKCRRTRCTEIDPHRD